MSEATTNPIGPRSASVRIDADTRTKLAELQKRLLKQSVKNPDLELRRGGIPLGMVVELGLEALERELNEDRGSERIIPNPKQSEP